jgi:hypothetical protein
MWGIEVYLHVFFIWAVVGSKWSPLCLSHPFTSGDTYMVSLHNTGCFAKNLIMSGVV